MGTTEVFGDLGKLMARFEVEPRGVIHVGAHSGQEFEIYDELFEHIMLVEPQPYYAALLREAVGKHRNDVVIVEAAVCSEPTANLHVTSFDQQTSIMRPIYQPTVKLLSVGALPLCLLAGADYNVLVVDAQGSELEVLRSGYLGHLGHRDDRFELVVVEVSTARRYRGAPVESEVIHWIEQWGWAAVKRYPHTGDPSVIDVVFVPAHRATLERYPSGVSDPADPGDRTLAYNPDTDTLTIMWSAADEIEEMHNMGHETTLLLDAPSGVIVGANVPDALAKYGASNLKNLNLLRS
jgi:FkbM family methyltransferase